VKKLLPFFLLISLLSLFLLSVKKFLFEIKRVSLYVEVKKGETVKDVAKKLESLGVVSDWRPLYYFMRVAGIYPKEGCYKIEGFYSPAEISRFLTAGSPCLKSFTILPGYDIFDVNRVLYEKGFCEKGEVLALSRDKEFLKELSVPFLEGFLFPDTYLVNRNSDCREALRFAVNNFKEKVYPLFDGYSPPEKVKRALSPVTITSILKVASIVEKETPSQEEKPVIAAVIYNRLIKGMKLQCDPTVFYAYKLKGINKEKLHKGDTLFPSPFNTYYVSGLPPTPICNPSLSSIKAAMYPAEVDYLYFVSMGNGRHAFSKSYNQHLKLVRKYLKNGKKVRN